MPWNVQGMLFPGRIILSALNRARSGPAVAPSAPTRPARVMSVFLIPGHALHEEGLHRQIGVGTLVSSQEQRALIVLLINRWSTACQPLVKR